MKPRLMMLLFGSAMLLSHVAQAATTVTATCKDGTTFSGPSRSGACKGHQGVQTWGTAAPAGAAATGSTPAATGSTAAATTSQTPAAAAQRSTTAAAAQPPTSAKSGVPGPGQVWVNSSSKVYHCAGSKWYGKTKSGKYMSEADAKAQGFHPDGGKACSA